MNNKQLYEKLGQNSYDKVFPITYLQNILDKDTNNDLTVVLSRFNHYGFHIKELELILVKLFLLFLDVIVLLLAIMTLNIIFL